MEPMEVEVELRIGENEKNPHPPLPLPAVEAQPWADKTELSFISDRLRLNLKILSTLRQSRGRGKFGLVFYTILEDISECSRNLDPNFDVNDACLCNKILPSIFDTISTLDELEFQEVQQALILFTFHKWEERKCIRTLRIVSILFGLIVKIAPSEVCFEFIKIFAKPEIPVHILLFVLPSIIRDCPKPLPDIPDLDPLIADYIKFIQIGQSENEPTEEDINYVNTFWSRMEFAWLPDDAQLILPICLEMKNTLVKMTDTTISKVLSIIKLQLESTITSPTVLINCAILLTGFSRFVFKECDQDNWIEIENLWISILHSCLQRSTLELDKETRLTCVKCLCSFLREVSVNSSEMLEEFRTKLSSVPVSPIVLAHNGESDEDIPIPTGKYFVEMLEDFLDQMKTESVRFVGEDRKNLMNVLKGIVNYAK